VRRREKSVGFREKESDREKRRGKNTRVLEFECLEFELVGDFGSDVLEADR